MADNMFVYHVTCVHAEKPNEQSKRKLSLLTKDCFREAILALFDLATDGSYIFQLLDPAFDDWIDIDDAADLPDKGKLKVTVCTGW